MKEARPACSMVEHARVLLFLFFSVGPEVAAEDEYRSLQGFWQRVLCLFLLPADRMKVITSRSWIKHRCLQTYADYCSSLVRIC